MRLNKTEIQKLAPMIDELAAGFKQSGNWLTGDLDTWDLLLGEYAGKPPSPRPLRPVTRTELQQTPRPMSPANDRPPLPEKKAEPQRVLTFDAQLILADTDKRILIGPPHLDTGVANRIWLPIISNETIAGYLGYRQIREVSDQIDKVFAGQQRSSFAYAALFMIVLSAVLAVAMAARIVRPIVAMNAAVSRISQGEFTHRLDAERLDEIGDLDRNINRLAATLDQNLRARQQWLAEISHELRTPVAIPQGELEGMLDGIIEVDDTAVASFHSESLRLLRLINDLHSLTLSDIGALNYHFEDLDLVSTVAARCQTANALASARDITVDLTLPGNPLFMRGDRQRLEPLFDNLIQNSVRYTDPGGTIRVCMEAQAEGIRIMWEDTSPGVTEEQLPYLFNVRGTTRHYRGAAGRQSGWCAVSRGTRWIRIRAGRAR